MKKDEKGRERGKRGREGRRIEGKKRTAFPAVA